MLKELGSLRPTLKTWKMKWLNKLIMPGGNQLNPTTTKPTKKAIKGAARKILVLLQEFIIKNPWNR